MFKKLMRKNDLGRRAVRTSSFARPRPRRDGSLGMVEDGGSDSDSASVGIGNKGAEQVDAADFCQVGLRDRA